MFRSTLITLVLSLFTVTVFAQPGSKKITQSEYIEKYKDDAIREMHRSGVPASITLAQGILESGNGNSALARYANNHFGIKCHSDWNGETFIQDDDEEDECFRKYKHVLESYEDHSDFLRKKRYAFLFDLKITDYKGWAHGLKKAGYATNPKYPKLLIDIIERNNLSQYDKAPKKSSPKKTAEKAVKKSSKVVSSTGVHQVEVHENNIKYIEVEAGTRIVDLAREFNMGEWQFYKYNDLEKEETVPQSGRIYLQPKRRKAQAEFHTVKAGETMWSISQDHGIKLKHLYKKNRMIEGDEPKVGTKLYLRKKKPV